jgi:hypothetical protein
MFSLKFIVLGFPKNTFYKPASGYKECCSETYEEPRFLSTLNTKAIYSL